jgi:hypothetical protein
MMVFAVLVAGIMELSVIGLAGNCVTFAARRAARFASIRGSASGHAASASDIQSTAQLYATPLAPASLAVTVSWAPDNSTGSTVQVKVAYSFRPSILPVSATFLTVQSTAAQLIQ